MNGEIISSKGLRYRLIRKVSIEVETDPDSGEPFILLAVRAGRTGQCRLAAQPDQIKDLVDDLRDALRRL